VGHPGDKSLSRRKQIEGVGLVNLATFSWATNMVLGRWLRADIGPITLAAARFLIASACFAFLMRRAPAEERRLGKDRWWLLAMALTGVVAFGPTLYLGLRYTTAVTATLLNGFGPLLTGLLASLFIREPMTRRQVLGALLGLAGVVVLISGGSLDLAGVIGDAKGGLIVLGSVLLWSVYSVLARQVMRKRSALSATALPSFLGLPFLLLAAIWELPSRPVTLTGGLVLAIIYIGFVPTVVGFFSWNAGVRRLGASGAMVFFNMLALYGALLGSLFLGEPVGLPHLMGGLLIVAGGLWAARSR
jgi:drug/metabolite transporter (DMT)-like permease